MSAFRYEQIIVDGVEISEVWGLDHVSDDKKATVTKEWLDRHAHRAKAQGYTHCRASVDPKDAGHLLFEAWPMRPDDEGLPRWFGGDG